MKKALFLVLTVVLLQPLSQPRAQPKTEESAPKSAASKAPNPQIQKIVSEISAANIEATIKKLVSFGTRHSLSETESNERGIGAARRWIKSEFDRYSRESGGRLQVAFDEFTQQPAQRIPTATQLVNVVAIGIKRRNRVVIGGVERQL